MNTNKNKIKSESLGKVKKLAYIVTLDNMLKSYDGLKKQDEEAIAKSGSSVSILTDAIIVKLTNLVNSERTLTCRNVLRPLILRRMSPVHDLCISMLSTIITKKVR